MKLYITTYDKRVEYARKTKEMLKDCPYEYFFVYGKGNTSKVEPFIEVDVPEAYEKLPEKTFCLVEHFMKNFKDEKLLKMNDDIFLDLEKLKLYENVAEDYVGYFHNYETPEYGEIFHWYKVTDPSYKVPKKLFKLMYAEGSTYILSRKSCEKILSDGRKFFETSPENYIGEDVHVGMSLEDTSITKKDIKMPSELCYEITTDFMSIHPVSLILLDKLMKSKTNEEKMVLLEKYNVTNENMLRLNYLSKVSSVMTSNQTGSNTVFGDSCVMHRIGRS